MRCEPLLLALLLAVAWRGEGAQAAARVPKASRRLSGSSREMKAERASERAFSFAMPPGGLRGRC